MKAKRKQELHTNELAQTLADAREFFSRYGNYVVGALAIVAIAIAIYFYSRRAAESARDAAFAELRTVRFVDSQQAPLPAPERDKAVETLRRVASEAKDPGVAQRALLRLGDGILTLCVLDPQVMSEELLQKAEDAYKKLLSEHAENVVAAGSAYLGLATLEENRFVLDGDLSHKEKAREHLMKVTQDGSRFNATPFMRRALDAVNNLDRTFQTVTLAAAPARPPLQPTTMPVPFPFEMPTPAGPADEAEPLDMSVQPEPEAGSEEPPAAGTEEQEPPVDDNGSE